MFGGTCEDHFPAVGGVKTDEGIGEEDDHKGFGGVAESRNEIAEEGFEDLDLSFAIGNQPGKGNY